MVSREYEELTPWEKGNINTSLVLIGMLVVIGLTALGAKVYQALESPEPLMKSGLHILVLPQPPPIHIHLL